MINLDILWKNIFPTRCVFCKKKSKEFLCKQHLDVLNLQPDVHHSKNNLTIYSIADYTHPPIKQFVFLYKFWGIFKISDLIAKELLTHFTNKIPKNSVLVPIPLHWSRYIWRGYNQSQKLAESLQNARPDLKICQNLKRIKKTKQQASLSKKERHLNMKNVFVWKNTSIPKNASIFLIDDVFTSGATLHEAHKELKSNSFTNIQALVFAKTK